MARIYSRKGDDGKTRLSSGKTLSKGALQVECYGTADELSSLLGLSVNLVQTASIRAELETIQRVLFQVGAILAAEGLEMTGDAQNSIREATSSLESWIDIYQSELPELKGFILPGGTSSASYLHLSRTVCRRTERSLVRLLDGERLSSLETLQFLNRLSDYLFTAARYENYRSGLPDILV